METKKTALAKDTTITSIDDEPTVVDTPTAVTIDVTDHGDNMSGERVQVTIQQGEGEIGRQAVFLGINGHGFNIPRGKPVSLPVEAVHILDNATQTVYETVGGKSVEREVPRFAYTVRPLPQ